MRGEKFRCVWKVVDNYKVGLKRITKKMGERKLKFEKLWEEGEINHECGLGQKLRRGKAGGSGFGKN